MKPCSPYRWSRSLGPDDDDLDDDWDDYDDDWDEK